jgi:ribosomal protein S18 acetylase RimI-like enzyme
LIEVGRLAADRWEESKALRLEALESDPTAFGSSVSDEAVLSESDWKRRAGNALFAFSDGKPVGMITVIVSSRPKTKHVAEIFGVYVKASERRRGIGKLLLEKALDDIGRNPEVAKIRLTVNPEQRAALELYRKAGFHEVGTLRRELRIGDRYYDELIMEKHIRA